MVNINRNELRQLKYNAIKQVTGDTIKAYKGREWSSARIEKEYGIKINDTIQEPIQKIIKKPISNKVVKSNNKKQKIDKKPKQKSKVSSKSDLKKLKYRAIKNAFHDTELAKKYANKSVKKIEIELGLKLPNSIPKFHKDVKPETKKRYERELLKYQKIRDTLIANGMDTKQAYKVAKVNKRKSFETIDKILSKYQEHNKIIFDVEYYNPLKHYFNIDFDKRVKLWSDWSKLEDYPEDIQDIAKAINLEKGLDKEHHLGWAVVYQAFIHEQDVNKLKEYFNVHAFEPEHYQRTHKIRR